MKLLPLSTPVLAALILLPLLPSCQVSNGVVGVTRPLFYSLGDRLHEDLEKSQQHSSAVKRFKGEPRLLQIGANEFYFDQDENKPFTFTSYLGKKSDDPGQPCKPWVIKPESMLTTGSSVPRQLWGVRGFGPFDFTKAAVVHDWLFEAHHRWCIAFYTGDAKLMKELREYADPELNAKLPAGHAGRSDSPMSIDDAANVMIECIDWEMRQCEHFVTALSAMLKADEGLAAGHPDKMTEGERRGVQAIVNDFSHVTHDHTMLAQYHWSIRSFVAKKFWDSGKKGGDTNTHASTDRTVALLKKRNLLKQAEDDGYLSSELVSRISKSEPKAQRVHNLELKVENAIRQNRFMYAVPGSAP